MYVPFSDLDRVVTLSTLFLTGLGMIKFEIDRIILNFVN